MAESAHDEYRAALALRHTPGIGPKSAKALAAAYGSLVEAARHAGEWPERRLARAPAAKAFAERVWRDAAEEEYASAKRLGLRTLTIAETRYPPLLREIPDPPVLLYVRGDVSLLSAPCVAVVGARMCSRYGLSTARRVCEEMSSFGLCIVSGMAYGIDRQAHLGGLAGVGGSVAVLGSGMDRVYPETNADLYRTLCAKGAVVTEYAPGTLPEARNFPVRNRIIAGLSLGVWVVEAAPGSGSLITARLGMEQGREVFALPGRIDDPTFTGCNELLGQGAHPVADAQSVLGVLRYQLAHLVDAPRLAAAAETPPSPAPSPVSPSGDLVKPPAERPASAQKPPADVADEEQPQQDAVPAADDAQLPAPSLPDTARALLDLLSGAGRMHIDAMTRALGLAAGEACGLLVELEVKGLVRQWPGMYYSLP
ncbi:DNA protecting protein DprA [Desulfovibrio sp. X2]|uniref:DNA-processing protein DprA n=1 Tax=Desulfovibrio sp. X2 TaxID=941449 RepID=UPI0003587099|nr:DNA-processing protein DprA [Desulfovibrio sp. X2]EPR39350.1 DNA protecting protein DprA [Desulfovibrio sp. X2]